MWSGLPRANTGQDGHSERSCTRCWRIATLNVVLAATLANKDYQKRRFRLLSKPPGLRCLIPYLLRQHNLNIAIANCRFLPVSRTGQSSKDELTLPITMERPGPLWTTRLARGVPSANNNCAVTPGLWSGQPEGLCGRLSLRSSRVGIVFALPSGSRW